MARTLGATWRGHHLALLLKSDQLSSNVKEIIFLQIYFLSLIIMGENQPNG